VAGSTADTLASAREGERDKAHGRSARPPRASPRRAVRQRAAAVSRPPPPQSSTSRARSAPCGSFARYPVPPRRRSRSRIDAAAVSMNSALQRACRSVNADGRGGARSRRRGEDSSSWPGSGGRDHARGDGQHEFRAGRVSADARDHRFTNGRQALRRLSTQHRSREYIRSRCRPRIPTAPPRTAVLPDLCDSRAPMQERQSLRSRAGRRLDLVPSGRAGLTRPRARSRLNAGATRCPFDPPHRAFHRGLGDTCDPVTA
jgi:hypothetical protein